jgi:hypothetical protein
MKGKREKKMAETKKGEKEYKKRETSTDARIAIDLVPYFHL